MVAVALEAEHQENLSCFEKLSLNLDVISLVHPFSVPLTLHCVVEETGAYPFCEDKIHKVYSCLRKAAEIIRSVPLQSSVSFAGSSS